MTDKQKQIAIAEAVGFTEIYEEDHEHVDIDFREITRWTSLDGTKDGKRQRIPDYVHDLNAMHEAEKVFKNDKDDSAEYARHLTQIVTNYDWDMSQYASFFIIGIVINATAAQRAEAFLRTIGKWEEES